MKGEKFGDQRPLLSITSLHRLFMKAGRNEGTLTTGRTERQERRREKKEEKERKERDRISLRAKSEGKVVTEETVSMKQLSGSLIYYV